MPRLEARVRLGLDLEVPVFLFFGMIRPYKGVTDLLEVWNAAPELHKNALLIIAGDARDPALTATIRGLAEQAPNVQLHMRFIADEEVPLFFGAADWLVLPFARSLTSGSAMLAQAYGRPVVASNVEGLQPDVAGRPEEVFEANDREALRGALARACKRTAASRQDACETVDNKDYRRDWAEIADQHAAAYGLAPVTSSKAA
jgi:glycosyltransferase involved in cell wall biosynthesis